MATTVRIRIPPRLEKLLKTYCGSKKITKRQAIIESLEALVRDFSIPSPAELRRRRSTGAVDIASQTSRLLKELRFGGRVGPLRYSRN